MTDRSPTTATSPSCTRARCPRRGRAHPAPPRRRAPHRARSPRHVAARLDEVLAGLSADRHDRDADEARRAPVIDLAARRRRTAANLLVAAAAVRGRRLRHQPGPAQRHERRATASAAATAAEDDAAGGAADSGGGDVDNRNAEPEAGPPGPTEYDGGAVGEAFRIRSERFGPDVRRCARSCCRTAARPCVEYPAPDCLTADARRRRRWSRRPTTARRPRSFCAPLGRRPGRRPLPVRRRRAAPFDHARPLPDGCRARRWDWCDWRGDRVRSGRRATPGHAATGEFRSPTIGCTSVSGRSLRRTSRAVPRS